MARRRMFSLDVVETDSFLELSVEARLLYYELGLRADDEGFVASPKMIIRTVGCKPDNLDELIQNRYVIKFYSGVIVITHWKMNNKIQADRFHNTIYQNELAQLTILNNVYYLSDTLDTECIRDVSDMETEVSVGKESQVKSSQVKSNSDKNNLCVGETQERDLLKGKPPDELSNKECQRIIENLKQTKR